MCAFGAKYRKKHTCYFGISTLTFPPCDAPAGGAGSPDAGTKYGPAQQPGNLKHLLRKPIPKKFAMMWPAPCTIPFHERRSSRFGIISVRCLVPTISPLTASHLGKNISLTGLKLPVSNDLHLQRPGLSTGAPWVRLRPLPQYCGHTKDVFRETGNNKE